jgi:O-antigen/teichoic acid export membrane protein
VSFFAGLFERWRRSVLARNAALAVAWQAVRVTGQAAWMIVLARQVGPASYGLFAGMAGLATALGTLTGFGLGVLMLQDTSRAPERFAATWKNAVGMTVLTGTLLLAVFVGVACLLFRGEASLAMYVAIGIPELLCVPLTIAASYAFQAHERMGWAGALFSLVPLGNLAAVAAFSCMPGAAGIGAYLPLHAVSSILAALAAVILVRRMLTPAPVPFALQPRDLREGAAFSLMRLADTGMTSLDKTLVLQLAGSEIAGIYGSAYRLVAVLAMPATAVGAAALPRLFRAELEQAGAERRLLRSLIGVNLAWGLLAALGAFIAGYLLPLLLGPGFAAATRLAWWLVPWPLLYGLYTLGCNVLLTSRRRHLRTGVQALGMGMMAAAAVLSMPRLGLPGPAVMLLSTQALLVLLVWGLIWRQRGKDAEAVTP